MATATEPGLMFESLLLEDSLNNELQPGTEFMSRNLILYTGPTSKYITTQPTYQIHEA